MNPYRYRIEPVEKNSIVTTTTYKNGDMYVSREETYRWGYAIVETSEDIDANSDEIFVTAYDLIENDYEDGVYVSWDYPDDLSDEDKEAIKNAYDEDGDDGLETLGWHYSDSEDKIVAPYKVSKV